MKVVLSQVNVGSKFRFMPSGVSSSLSNYPRDGWLTEAAARKWAKANGHEIVKVEKVAGNGEKIHRIEYTYKDRFGKTKKQTSELVGKDVEPLKKRIVEGLTRNGDKLISFGKVTTKDSAEDSTLVSRIAEKYAMDATLITAKSFVTAPGLPTFKLTFDVIKPDGTPTGKKVTKNIGARDKNEAVRIAEDIELKDRKLLLKKVEWAGKTTIAQGPQFLVKPGRPVYNRFDKSSKDSADDFASDTLGRIRAKYCLDAVGAGVVNPNFKFSTNVERRLATTRRGKAMTLPQYGKPSKVTVKKDGNSFSVIGKDGQRLNNIQFKSYEEAEKWARGNGFMVKRV